MLTAKQHQTYQFIKTYILQYGYAPTAAEIALGIGIHSRGVVHRYVSALSEAGFIKVIPGKRRNIELIQDKEPLTSLPILGKIAAGEPIEAIEDQELFDVTEVLLKPNRFILQVKGDSMIGDSICDGDLIICEYCEEPANGKIVIALLDNQEVTLKRFQKNRNDTVTLIPSNPSLSPMIYAANRIKIQGIYLGLLRLV